MHYKLDDLEQLVKAMSGQEKRYFSLFSETFAHSGETPLYLQLFRAISKPRTELPDFSKEISEQAFTTTKKRLFRNILKSLSVYHHEKSPDMMIQNLLGEIEILYHLNLPSQGLFPLDKAYQLAVSQEKFGLLLQVLDWERRLNMILNAPTRPASMIQAEEREVLVKLQQIMELENIYSRAKELKKDNGYVKGNLKRGLKRETIQARSMHALADCKSQKAIYYYNFIYALYHWMVFDHTQAYNYSKELLGTKIQVVLPNDYIDGILEHVTSCVCLGNFDAALNGLKIAEVYISEQKLNLSHSFRLKIFYYQVSYHIIIYNFTGNKVKLLATVKDAESQLKQFDGQLPSEFRVVIFGNLMNAYLGLGNHKKVDEIWNSLFHKQYQSTRRDIYDDLYLFRLFNLLQSRTYEVLPSMASSAFKYYRKFKDHDTHFSLEMKICGLLMKELDYSRSEIKREVLEEIRAQLSSYMASFTGTNGFQEHYTLYLIWIESLISERPFSEEAEKWYKGFMKMVS